MLASLRHPAVIRLLESHYLGGVFYFVMEHAEGGPLVKRVYERCEGRERVVMCVVWWCVSTLCFHKHPAIPLPAHAARSSARHADPHSRPLPAPSQPPPPPQPRRPARARGAPRLFADRGRPRVLPPPPRRAPRPQARERLGRRRRRRQARRLRARGGHGGRRRRRGAERAVRHAGIRGAGGRRGALL